MTAGHGQSFSIRPAADVQADVPGLRSAVSLVRKLASWSILITLVVLVLLCWAALTIASDLVAVAKVADMQLPKLELIQEAKYVDLAAGVALSEALMAQDRSRIRAALDRYGQFTLRADEVLARIASTTRSERNRARVNAALQAHKALVAARAQVVERLQRSSKDPLQDGPAKSLEPALNGYLAQLHVIYEAESRSVDAGISDALVKTLRARWLIALASVLALLAVLQQLRARFREGRELAARKDREIDALQRQRDGLVREVHHRIKNHLQGLLALVDGHAAGDAATARRLHTLQGHVLALINVHGLQAGPGYAQSGVVSLRELVANQLPLIGASFPATTVRLEGGADAGAMLNGDQAVPVALAVTELVVNGLKHGVGGTVAVAISGAHGTSEIAVTNRVDAPPVFDCERGIGLGTGLELVASLLTGIGRVVQRQSSKGELTMTIHLSTAAG